MYGSFDHLQIDKYDSITREYINLKKSKIASNLICNKLKQLHDKKVDDREWEKEEKKNREKLVVEL